MESSAPPETSSASAPDAPSLSLLQRTIAIFARPADAWGGLRERSQWWFPLVLTMVVSGTGSLVLYHRAQLPTMIEALETQVANGQMPAEQLEKIENFYSAPAGVAMTVGIGTLSYGLILLVMGLVVWFGVGFVLGKPFGYRLGLEVSAWAGLVTLPAYLVTLVLAWFKQSYHGVHVGFGALLPDPDPPSKMITALGAFLDALGPFSVWHLAVAILGASALAGAPRKSVAWVLIGLYLAITLFVSALAGLFAPGA
jgi:hypothetical protein